MATESERKVKIPLIGVLAVKNMLITKEELQSALSACSGAQDPEGALKEYLLKNEMISAQNLERLSRAAKALELRQKEYKFGAIAIRKGFINKSVLGLALEEQEKCMREKKKLNLVGDLLVDAGLLTVQQRDYILKLQKRFRPETKIALDQTSSKINKQSKVPIAEKDAGGENGTDRKDSAEGDIVKEDPPVSKGAYLEGDNPEEDASSLLEPEIIDGGVKLEVSRDFMAAFLSKTDYFDKNITVDKLKDALFDKGIVKGIVTDEMIEGFIKSSGFKTKSFRAAKGIVPIQGKNAKLEFFFNTDYLQAGGLSENGAIDFKDRGEIPHVEEGTVLAEKTPMVESRTGQNIYGDEIGTIPGEDILLKIGKGAKLSEDGFKVIAAVNGFPKYTLSGHVFVHQEYATEGDVDYETGHIQYDGNVNIKGRIKSGFKVSGNNITAVELDGGILTADGDVNITGGINEGKIYSRGNVYARFIHKSEIICMGNVVVEKEIVDSQVESSGSCVVQNGKLISSNISSKMGVQARNIGTEMAAPNMIKVGHDVFTTKELEKNKVRTDKIKEQIKEIEEKKKTLSEENAELQKQITELAHVQDRSQLEEKELNSKIDSIEQNADTLEKINELKERIQQLQENAQKAEESLDHCFDKSEEIEEAVEKCDKEIKKFELKRDDLLEERANLIQWSKDNPGKPVVIAEGAIMPETVIKGKHSEKRINEVIRRARVLEVLINSEEGQNLNVYEMQVGNI